MNVHKNRSWMYTRLLLGRKGYIEAFLNGIVEFVSFALEKANLSNGKIRCLCSKCKNLNFLDYEDVKVHLYRRGFVPPYWYWTCHGEIDPTLCHVYNTYPKFSACAHEDHNQDFDNMIHEAVGVEFSSNYDQQNEECPNTEAKYFYDLLHASQKPLWPRRTNHTELSVAIRFLTIKSEGNMSQRSFNQTMALLKETHPKDNFIPEDYYRTLKLVSKLGLYARKINCCVDGCMLFYSDEDKQLTECKFCHKPRYKTKKVSRGRHKDVPMKRMHYLHLIPKLRRLYA